jgi:hypothetical protein
VPGSVQTAITRALGGNSNVGGVTGVAVIGAPLQDLTSGQTKNRAVLVGVAPDYPAAFGPLLAVDGTSVRMDQLGAHQAYLNQRAGDALGARPGDHVTMYVGLSAVQITVPRDPPEREHGGGRFTFTGEPIRPHGVAAAQSSAGAAWPSRRCYLGVDRQ